MRGFEYGVLDELAWHTGVTTGAWWIGGGFGEVLQTLMGAITGVRWIVGRVSEVCSCCRVSCIQKLPLATLAMLIATSMLATHTWHAIVGPRPSVLKFVFMLCRCQPRSAVHLVFMSSLILDVSLLCCLKVNQLLM